MNCGQSLSDENFCPNCGQLNNTAKPTFGQLIADTLANLFAWDSKFYLSIWPLMVRPGKLSLEIVNGKKSSYLPPIRLFVLMVIFTFLLFSIFNRANRGWDYVDHLREEEHSIASFHEDSVAQRALDSVDTEVSTTSWSIDTSGVGDYFNDIYEYVLAHPEQSAEDGLRALGLNATFWNRFLYTSSLKFTLLSDKDAEAFIASNALIILMLFIPVLALLLKALYFYKRDYYYVDHFVFAVHQQTALFVFIVIYKLISQVIDSDFVWFLIFLVLFPTHLFLALKNFYQQRKRITAINFVILNTAFFVVGGFFLFLVAAVSFILV